MKNAVLKCNQLDAGWYVAKKRNLGKNGGKFHIFKVDEEMNPEIKSLCGWAEYRNINSRCVKKSVDDPGKFLQGKRKVCGDCLDRFNNTEEVFSLGS